MNSKNENPYLIEGTLRHQKNIIIAKNKYGMTFNCEIINTNYFDDSSVVPTLVCIDDINLVLGKPRYPENFIDDEYKIKLVDRNNMGIYSIDIMKCHKNKNARDKIKENLIFEIEKTIDNKVYKWMETKQTKFNIDEKDKMEEVNIELIKYLNTLRDTSKIAKNFRERTESFYIGYKIISIIESMDKS